MMIQGNNPDDLAFDFKNKDKRTEFYPPITGKDVPQRFITIRVRNKIEKLLLDLIKKHSISFLEFFKGFIKAVTKFNDVFHVTGSSDISRRLFD